MPNFGTILDPLRFWARVSPENEALVMGDRRINYHLLDCWSNAAAGVIESAGVKPGDVVSITGDNSIEWVIAALGALKAGAVLAPLNQRAVATEYEDMLDLVEPRLVIADSARFQMLEAVARDGVTVWAIDKITGADPTDEWNAPERDPTSPSVLVFTSGSSGSPKAVIHTDNTIIAARTERQMIEPCYSHGMKQLLILPLYAMPGTIGGFISTIFHGGTFFVEPSFDAARALKILVEERITILQGVPLTFRLISQQPLFDAADLSGLKSAHVGGAPVPTDILAKWRGKGVTVRHLYGMTETCGGVTVSTNEEGKRGSKTCGPGGIYTRLRIAGAGLEAGGDGTGQILVRGPTCAPGYWRNDVATSQLYSGSWLQTGDIGRFDEHGNLLYIDRMKDLIISGGINVSPSEIERVITEYAERAEVAVIAAFDEKFGETPAAIVYTPTSFDVAECITFCNERLSDYKVPRYLVKLQEPLPRLSNGKINKVKIKSDFRSVHLAYDKVR